MKVAATTNGTQTKNGRDDKGRFISGNPGGPGRFAGRMAAIRKILALFLSEDDIKHVTAAMLKKPKEGDRAAARLILQCAAGKRQENSRSSFLG